VREKPSQRVSQLFFFSQKNTEEQNTQRPTETLSQPISQSVTANVSWKASVISVCRRRSVSSKRWLKCSVKSVSSVREKTPQRVSQMFFFSQKNTEERNTRYSTETLSQPISQNLTANRTLILSPARFKNLPCSFQEHALLHSRTCPSTSKNTPFLMLDKALL